TVLSCGFDSVPLDLGVLFLQADALQRFGQPLQRVQGRVLRMRGGVSGGTAASLRGHALALGWPPSRALIGRLALPQPGLGPCWRLRETGSVNLRFTGQTAYGRSLAATVHGDRDPGHGRTARMLAKSALRRLQAHAGLRFSLVA
ncbi:MAG: hypothetical protein QE285_07245, partial [Aquabacterium sp.]|nr:hypothetical protein [Aquabacterium sp.]